MANNNAQLECSHGWLPRSPDKVLEIDASDLLGRFQKPFRIRHNLVKHRLFALPSLVDLARSLPECHVEFNSGNVPVNLDPKLTPRTGLSIEETIRRIEECGSWMVLKYVEQDFAYRELLDRCLDEVMALCDPPLERTFGREAFIFISSPSAVTPYHIDPEHNFLLQIRGQKALHVFDDPTAVSERELEKFYAGAHRNLVFRDDTQSRGRMFALEPGDGLYVPVTTPHWVQNGESVSVSFSITFRSLSSERRATVYRVNHIIRKLGLHPTPYGRYPFRDAAIWSAFRTASAIKRRVSGQPKDRGKARSGNGSAV